MLTSTGQRVGSATAEAAEDELDAPENPSEVRGRVKGPFPEGATVRAILHTLCGRSLAEQVVGEASVDADGWFQLPYERPAGAASLSRTSLVLQLRGTTGNLLSESAPLLTPPQRARVDLRLPRGSTHTSEYALLHAHIRSQLQSGPEILDDVEGGALDEVAQWLDVEPERLALLQRARELEARTGLTSSLFYAMGRRGLPMTLEDLVDVPMPELRTTVQEAVTDEIVDGDLLPDLDAVLAELGARILDNALEGGAGSTLCGLGQVLATADLSSETIRAVLARYQARTGGTAEFWESLFAGKPDGESFGEDVEHELELAVELGGLVGADPPLLRRLHELRREGRWQSTEDLAELDFDDWCELIEEVGDADEADDGEWVEARADAIVDALEQVFPSRCIRRELVATEEIGDGARRILERTPDHDLLKDSIRARVSTDATLLEGFDESEAAAAMEEIEAAERIARVTPRADEVVLLVGTGMDSAHKIGAMPRLHFVETYGEALGGRAQASRVHAQAQQNAAAGTLAMLRLLQALQQMPLVLGGGLGAVQSARDTALKDIPDARALFGNIGSCGCEHCSSVYSPAAYFVDLLRYLDIRDVNRLAAVKAKLVARGWAPARVESLSNYQPLDALLARRPDLADIYLTCENTLTTLPYIDLVNEVLEAQVTRESVPRDTGKVPADVLKAVPQHLQRDAYRRLQEAVHPSTLPYHQPLAVARAYLGHLGVTRAELLKALPRDDQSDEPLLAEQLGMSRDEFAAVARPPQPLWQHFGFAAEQDGNVSWVEALARAPALLDATGMTFQDLVDLSSTRFINSDDAMKLASSASDCDPEKVRIVGLDEARLSRMLRLLRLRRRLNWSFADLDRALVAFAAQDVDAAALRKLVDARDLGRRLDRPIAELLGLWAPLDTWGENNQFERLLQTRAVAWRTEDANMFKLRDDRAELAQTGDSLDPVAPALLAAFRITNEELSLARAIQTRRGSPPRLDLAGLSAVYRLAVLARALRLRMDQLDGLLRLIPPDADPLQAADPGATRRFVAIVEEVQASDFSPERLMYLFHPMPGLRRDAGPTDAQVDSVVASIRRGLVDAFSETAAPSEITGDALRQKLAIWLDAGLVDQAMEVLDPRSRATPAQRREFFDRHLARIFPNAADAATRLFGEPAPSSPTPSTGDGGRRELEQRWTTSIAFVLEHLLPSLRTRQMRGAVVQVLGDTLGTSSASTARLVESLLRSRRERGQPLLRDFFALLGTGLTGAYFANSGLGGAPLVTRVDPKLEFSWAGAPAAPGLPGQAFSVRWTGRLMPRAKAPHTFFVSTDGAVRIAVKVGGEEKVLLDQPTSAGRVAEHATQPVALDPKELCEITIEYRNEGAHASFAVQYGTSPTAKQSIPTPDLYPSDALSSFAPVAASYRRLHKAALLVTGFGITEGQLEWLSGDPKYLDLDALPMDADRPTDAVALFRRWRQLAALYALRKRLPRANTDLFQAFRMTALPAAIDTLSAATGWDKGVVEAFVGPRGFAVDPAQWGLPLDAAVEPFVVRLERAVNIQRRVGMAPEILFSWAHADPDADVASAIVQAVKSRYDEKRWLEVAQSLNDPLRIERRDALVAYLLPRMRDRGVKNRNQLFEYFLIDVDMNPCMSTSRIKQAISAVQTFFQRCLMNLESQVPPRLIDENDWKWLKNYRVWEANRKIFLYPENWIEPELRDDKSPLFQELERTILQQEIKKENVESAFIDYLQKLDEVSRLDVRAVWYEPRTGIPRLEQRSPTRLPPPPPPQLPPTAVWDNGKYRSHWDDGTYHVFARSFDPPHVWYYRRLEKGRNWTPWEKIDADIEGDHLVPVVFQRRMYLFWTVFREVPKPAKEPEKDAVPYKLGKDWEISVAYSVYDRGRWSRKRLSSAAIADRIDIAFMTAFALQIKENKKVAPRIEGSAWLPKAAYALRATVSDDRDELRVYLHRRAVDLLRAQSSPRVPESAEEFLAPDVLQLVASFGLDGCNGELDARRLGVTSQVILRTPTKAKPSSQAVRGRIGASRRKQPVAVAPARAFVPASFRAAGGGRLDVPAGYQVDGTGYVPARRGHASLSLSPGQGRGSVVVLRQLDPRRARLVPVVHPTVAPDGGVFPFFYQDGKRSYFVRPVAAWIGAKVIATPVARPLVGARALRVLPRFGRAQPRPARAAPIVRGRREALESAPYEASLAPRQRTELDDARDDREDEAWHPDDASERRPQRRTRQRAPAPQARPRPPAPAPRRPAPPPPPSVPPPPVVPQFQMQTQTAHYDWRLRFTPFEHPATCRLIKALKSGGIEELLALKTTRPEFGRDHTYRDGKWVRTSTSRFAQNYGPGPLTDVQHPHLDIEFDLDNPYALYNWELFFHAPLQVAIRLAKDGRHEEAQRWFHFIFDPTSDVSSPSPQRYWRFAPFHENTEYEGARELMALLSYSGSAAELIRKQDNVNDQVAAWWEKPFSPHVIARLRTAAYQKAVVMKYIDNLIEWGDKLFRRDTMETIQEATQLYILAGNILGPRPERVPPMVKVEPVTFRTVRQQRLDPFANWVVQFENSQVRRPFRINAAPDVGGTSSVLGMATQYFCVPPNPQMDKYWDTVADRLFKIRNCMNIKGVVRQLALFEPPIDPGMLVRAAAAGADLGSVIADLNAPPPHHRFRPLVARAVRMAQELRSFGASTLKVLERRDAEELAALRTSHETTLLEAVRDIGKTKIKQVEEELVWLALERDHVDMQIMHVFALAQQLMNPQETARQQSLTGMQVVATVAEGIDLVSKVLYAIPDFQAGVAGGFSSPFTTLQLGGQMFGDISAAVAESMFKVMNRFQTEADMAQAQAEYQRRQAELVHQHELLLKEKEKITKQIGEINLKLEIHNAELRRHEVAVENSRKIETYLRNQYTNEQLYGWMLGQISGTYFQAYKFAFDTAKLAERALRFERGDPSAHYIEFSYWDSFKKGLYAGERLLVDLRRMEAAYTDGDARALEITRHLSLRLDAPTVLQTLLATGRAKLEVTETLLDGDFPGHYFRRLKTVSMTVLGPVSPHSNVNCTLTLLGNRIRTNSNASGAYPQSDDTEDPRFLVNFAPVQVIATSRPNADAGVFELRFDDDRYLPFEGAGAISSWRIDLQQSDNAVDLARLTDVVLTLSYTAKSGGAPLEAVARANRVKGLGRGGLEPPPQHLVSLAQDLPDLWKRLGEANAGQEIEVPLSLPAERFPARFRGLSLQIERVTAYARPRADVADDALSLRLDPPKGSGTPLSGWTRPWPGSRTLRASADTTGAPGAWKLAASGKGGKVPDLFEDVVLILDLRARST